MRIVFKKMSFWTPLTMYLGMKTTFYTEYVFIANMFGLLLWGFKIFRVIGENAYLKKYSLQDRAHTIGF